jgi:hypothetical protein
MLQNYAKLFIHRSVLVPVPGPAAPEFINRMSTIKEVKRWVKELYKMTDGVTVEIGIEHPFWSFFMIFHHHVVAAGGWVRNESGELLVIERNGKLDMPKGKLESKENVEDCAVREVEEECRVKRCRITGPYVRTYHCYPDKGEFALKTTYWFPMYTDYSKKLKPQIEEGITAVYWANQATVAQRLKEIPSYNSLEEVFNAFLSE